MCVRRLFRHYQHHLHQEADVIEEVILMKKTVEMVVVLNLVQSMLSMVHVLWEYMYCYLMMLLDTEMAHLYFVVCNLC